MLKLGFFTGKPPEPGSDERAERLSREIQRHRTLTKSLGPSDKCSEKLYRDTACIRNTLESQWQKDIWTTRKLPPVTFSRGRIGQWRQKIEMLQKAKVKWLAVRSYMWTVELHWATIFKRLRPDNPFLKGGNTGATKKWQKPQRTTRMKVYAGFHTSQSPPVFIYFILLLLLLLLCTWPCYRPLVKSPPTGCDVLYWNWKHLWVQKYR